MRKFIWVALAVFGILGGYFVYGVARGFMDAARHGGSPAARERRLIEISKQQNVGLPKDYGGGAVMVMTKAGPGLRFTYVFQLANITGAKIDTAKFAARARSKLTDQYKTLPELADFRKWQVELCHQFLDKGGKEITTVTVSPQDL